MAKGKYVRAKDAVVVNVDGRPIKYGEITIRDRRTNELATIDNQNEVLDEGDEGMPYAFAADEKVSATHPAVKANPGAFRDETGEDDE